MAKKKKKKSAQQVSISPERYLKEKVRNLPIGRCYVTKNWQETGLASIIVTRQRPNGNFDVGMYLVDTFCLGVKNSFYRLNMENYDLQGLLDKWDNEYGIEEVKYVEVHNIIYGAIEFADEAGLEPDKTFNLSQYILEEDTDEIPLIEYEFGQDGKYTLIIDHDSKYTKYIPTLQAKLGDDFEYIVKSDFFGRMDNEEEADEDEEDFLP